MRTRLARYGLAVVCAAALLPAAPVQAAKPVRPATLSTENAPPLQAQARGVPVPAAGVGLPALLLGGAFAWSRRRSRPAKALPTR